MKERKKKKERTLSERKNERKKESFRENIIIKNEK